MKGLDSVTVSAKIPKELFEKIKKTVKKRGYVSISDFIRDLIRREFKS